jgi:AcrR family transcriptional regulator
VNVVRNTPIPDRRQRRRDARRRAIEDAALRLLVRDGPAGLTMPALAAELDVAVGGLYRTFPSKDALLVALQLRAVEGLGALLEARLAAAGEDPLARVRAAFGTWSAWSDLDPVAFSLVDASLSAPERLLSDADAAAVEVAVAPILARCAATLAAAAAVGALSDGDHGLRTLVVWAAARGARHLAKRDRGRAAAVEQAAIEGLLAGWAGQSTSTAWRVSTAP